MKLLYIDLFSNFVMTITIIYFWHKLLHTKFNFKSIKIIISTAGIMAFSIPSYYLVNKYIRILVITIVFTIFVKYLFNTKLQQTVVTPIYSQILVMISEFIYALIILLLKIDITSTIESNTLNLISNLVIAIILIVFSNLKVVHSIYRKIIDITLKISKIQLSTFCIIVMLIANILAMSPYYKIEFKYLFIFNILMTIMCFVIIFYTFKTKSNYNSVYDKYNIAINSLRDYENMMAQNRIDIHENKNLLLAIRAMIINKEKNIPDYINSIIQEKYEDNEKLQQKISIIPSGGLRATIYSELLKIQSNRVSYSLNIDNLVKTVDLIELDTNTIIDICKILGVVIDNAISEASKIEKGNIIISLYVEKNKLCIKVSNNFAGKVDVGKIYDEGFTTKGKGHGYGLSLVKKIIDNNSQISDEIEINNDIFNYIVSIEYNKKSNKYK